MTWSYSPSALPGSTKDAVRVQIGDVLSNEPQLQDEEIENFIAGRYSIFGACADCCRAIASKFSRSVTQKANGASANYSDLSKAYLRMAIQFDNLAASGGAAMPYAGGISIMDKQVQESNSDRVSPNFNIGMMDNDIMPIGPVGNETPDSPAPASDT